MKPVFTGAAYGALSSDSKTANVATRAALLPLANATVNGPLYWTTSIQYTNDSGRLVMFHKYTSYIYSSAPTLLPLLYER